MGSHQKCFAAFVFLFVAAHAPAQEQGEIARIGEQPFVEWVVQWRAAAPAERQILLDNLQPANGAAWPAMLALLKDGDSQTREVGCMLVQSRYQEIERIEAALTPLLEDPAQSVRFAAARIAFTFDPKRSDPRAWTVLQGFARGPDPALRLEAVRSLRGNANDERVVDLLLEFVHVDDVQLRRAAFDGLCGGDDDQSREAQQAGLSDPDEQIRVRVAHTLVFSGRGSDEVAAVLLPLLMSEESYVRDVALNALAQLGAERAADIAPAMIAALHDPEAGVRGQAAYALGALGSGGADLPDAVPGLVELVKDASQRVRRYAAFALGRVGAATDVAVPALATLLQDPSAMVRSSAIDSLKQAGGEVVLALPQLIAALNDPDAATRARVAELIALGGAKASDATAALTSRLADPNLNARLWAAYALREIGSAAALAAQPLAKALAEDPESKMRVEAARALAGIGPLAGASAIAVVDSCKDPDVDVRLWSLFALGEIGVKSEPVLAALREAATSSDERVLVEANKALEKLGEAHDAQAIARAPAAVPTGEPIGAPIDYRTGLALLLSDADSAAVVVFFDDSWKSERDVVRSSAHYRFRYLAKGQAEPVEGEGEVHVVRRKVVGIGGVSEYAIDAPASDTDLDAGSLHVGWDDPTLFGNGGRTSKIWWRPEQVRAEFAENTLFDSLDLRRFIR